MSQVCQEAILYFDELLGRRNIKEALEDVYFEDGDFVINGYLLYPKFYGIPLMKDEYKIPKLVEVREKIEKWAKENDLELSGCFIDSEEILILKRTYTHPKNWEEKIKKIFRIKENIIFVGDHYFGSEYPELFEKFGREIYRFKTYWEKHG